tara:strand:- start:19514 stop:20344 length:831 start_codon:yes stop_codon:yes gene_type:complete
MKKLYKLLRVKHYIKNFIIFAPLLFTTRFENIINILNVFKIFAIFCILASIVYILNDIVDIKSDKLHPKKKQTKPLASGLIDLRYAKLVLFQLITYLIILLYFFPKFIEVSLIYILLNIAYSYLLKNIFLIDIFSLSLNYLIRVYSGCLALDVNLSHWMAVTIFSGALTISSIKRERELFLYGYRARKVLKYYGNKALRIITISTGILSATFYSLYVVFNNEEMFVTIPLIIYAIFRFIYRSKSKYFTDSPVEEILKDRQNYLIIFFWLIIVIFYD